MTAGRLVIIDNTKAWLMKLLELAPWKVTDLVRIMYAKSKQPDKKTRTFTRHLRQLERAGLAQECGGIWMLTGRYRSTIVGRRPPPKRPLRLAA